MRKNLAKFLYQHLYIMASTSILKHQLILDHQALIEQLESKYANQTAALLKQKKQIILRMQQQFYKQIERIHNFNESINASCYSSNSRVNTYNEESVNESISISNPSSMEHAQHRIDKYITIHKKKKIKINDAILINQTQE